MPNTITNSDLRDWDRRHYWHAFTQMSEYEPLIIERAEGCRLIDIAGREYLDGAASLWCNVHGHRHPRIDAAIREQLDRVAHCTSLGMGCDTTARLAKRLADLAPGDLEHVFFSSDGSSAVEVALKMAFQYWRQCENARPEKTKFIALGEAYHGDTIGSASVGGIPRFHALFKPLLFDVVRAPLPDPRRLGPTASPQLATETFLGELKSLLQAHHRELAAMVIEPLVQCAAGMVMHPLGYLRGVRELTKRYDVLLIADEIAVGFGRTGTMFACEQEGVVPDFLCLGKGLAGGYLPMAATLTNDRIYNAFLGSHHESRTLHHGHTFSGNPLAAAAALVSLDVFDDEQTLARLSPKVARLGEHLGKLAEHRHVATTRQRGLIGALELTPDKSTGVPYPAQERRAWETCCETLSRGVWLRPLADVLYVMPPLAISLNEIDLMMDTLVAAIDVVTEK
ncbi:MAG: adenosylmethionine--8-amino-7-oxononanoate transaminase [Planctomycetes bacterium]|nr:adenosylmethionine--8-amino-7-oxononanoate transaminase [Planctomycetota bacterium]